MTKKKKVWIIVLSVVGGVILLAALGLFLLNQLFSGGLEPHVVWFTEESPSGSFTLRVDKDQSPAWPFGSQGIYIYVEDELLVETALSNDGKQASDANYTLSWEGDVATLCLKGEEQGDRYYEITYQNGEASYESYSDTIGVEYMDRMGITINDPKSDTMTYFEISTVGDDMGRAFQMKARLSDITAGKHVDDGSAEIYDQQWVDLGAEQLEQIKTALKKFTGYSIVGQQATARNGVQLEMEFPDSQNWKVEFEISTQGKTDSPSVASAYLDEGTLYYYDTGEFPNTYQELMEQLWQIAIAQEEAIA